MRHLNFLCYPVIFLMALACSKKEFGAGTDKTVSVDKTNITFTYSADNKATLSVISKEKISYDVTYTEKTETDWLSLTETAGNTSETLLEIKTLSANELDKNRSAVINITAKDVQQSVKVVQEFFDPVIYIIDRELTLKETEGDKVDIIFDIEADWTAELIYEKETDWLDISKASGNPGDNQKITLTTKTANQSQIEKKATLRINYWTKKYEVKILQNAAERVMIPDKTEIEIAQASGQSQKLTFDITKDWTTGIEYADGETSWLTLNMLEGTKGNGISVDITATSANRGKTDRTATVKFIYDGGYYPITVTQKCVAGNLASDIDPDFLKLLSQKALILDEDIVTAEQLAAIKKIEIAATQTERGSLTSLKGIELMPSLQVLKCDYHNITSLDLSHNSNLVELYVTGNGMTELNVSNTPKLVRFYAQYNKISSIDLSNKPVLRLLYLGENNLTSLDITGCSSTALIGLTCANNPGQDGIFKVKAWFDNSSIPSNFTKTGWTTGDGSAVQIIYEKVGE